MAFANLFKTLSPAEEHHAIPIESPHPHKNGVQEVFPPPRQNPDGQQTGQKKKKTHQHFNQAMTAKTHGPPRFYDYDNPDGVPRGPAHFKRRGRGQFHHRGAFSQHAMDQRVQHHKFQNTTTTTTTTFKQEMQQQNMGQKKKMMNNNNKQENGQSQSGRGGFPRGRRFHQGERRERFPTGRGRGHTQMHQNKRDPAVERVRHMTQEFKDQNALEANGQLLCKHFLMGRCNKGEECQLVHRSAHNDLIKEACKFYIQGVCFKEESCAYMHSSFPCKYFHQWGRCAKEGDCRFSHEPLTDLTKQLLDQAIQREKDLSEMAKKSQQESQAAPEDLEGPAEASGPPPDEAGGPPPDVLLHPIRPQFYNSSCPEEPPPEPEGLTGAERGPARTETASPSCRPPNSNAVPYSVEAVLGPVISKPFPSLFGSSGDLTSSSSPRRSFAPPTVPAHRAEAPYSVEAVLRSVDSVGSTSTSVRDQPPSAGPPLTYYGSDRSREFPKPSRFSGLFSGKDLCLKHNTGEAKARPNGNRDVPSSNQDHKQAERCVPVNGRVPPYSQSSAEGAGGVINSDSSTDVRVPPDTGRAKDTQKAFHSLFANPLNQSVFNPPHLTPLAAAAPPTRATPSTNRKEKTASPDANTGHNTHVLARSLPLKPAHRPSAAFKVAEFQSTESPGPAPRAQTARGVSKRPHCDGSVRSKPVKRPYHSSVASSGTDSDEDLPPLQIATDWMPGSSDSPERSVVEPGEAPGGVLRGLFATPIHQTAAPLPSTQGTPRAFTPRPGEASSEQHPQNSGATGSPAPRPHPKHPKQKERKSRSNNRQPPARSVQKDSHVPQISSDKAPSHDATNASNSVLKTLFLNLSPYNQEEERLIHSKSGDKDEINHRAVSKERQTTGEKQEKEEETRRKEMRSTEMLGAVEPAGRNVRPDHQLQGPCRPPSRPPAPHRPLGKHPHSLSPGAPAGRPARRLDPVRLVPHSAGRPLMGPKGPRTPLAQSPVEGPLTRTPLAQSPLEGPLRSLFKTLDPAASPFGN